MVMMNRPHWLLVLACWLMVETAHGQRPQAGRLDPVETVNRYVALRLRGAPWADLARLIVWEDEPLWDTYWLVNRYTVGTAENTGNTVTVPVTFHRLGVYSHDVIFKQVNGDVTVRYELVKTPAGWLIKGPEPDLPDLSVDVQIEALRTAAHSQNETAEVRKQAEAMAERLSALTRPQPKTISAQPRRGQDELSVRRFLQSFDSDLKDRFVVGFADLNSDGKPEAFVYLTSNDWCGSGGCTTLVLVREAESWRLLSEITITRLPIRMLGTKSHGWRDITVWVQGGGIQPGYETVLQFDGETYPGNPSMPPAKPLAGKTEGEIVIPSAPER